MSDNMKKVRSGDPLVIPAPAYNAFIDAAQDYRARTANVGQQATPVTRSSGIVMVKNESGTDRARFDVLGLGEPLFMPDGPAGAERSFMNAVAFRGDTPDAMQHMGKFVVLLEPIAADAVGRACISGITVARLRVDDGTKTYTEAEIIDQDEIALGPKVGGSVDVLWHQDQAGDVWAVIRIGNSVTTGFWFQITATAPDNLGIYDSWQQVEVVDDGEGGLSWSTVVDGLTGTDDGTLYEVNATANIPIDTVVFAMPNPAFDPQHPESGLPAWLFQYELPQTIGYGKPVSGETDVPYNAEIDLTITDEAGAPILDDEGQEQTIKVWRNALGRPLYTDFASDSIFVYVRYPAPGSNGIGGCIFSRTEAFNGYQQWLPSTGYSLLGGEQPPASTDITGDPGNSDHVHVLGKMFMLEDSDGKGWAPWFVLDPESLGSFKVKTDVEDTTPGYLDEEITVTPAGGGHEWIKKTVQPGGVADNKLLLEHNDWDEPNVQQSDPVPGNLVGGNGVEILQAQPNLAPYIEYQEVRDHFDAKHHSLLTPQIDGGMQPIKQYIKLPGAVYTDAADTTPGFLNDEIITDPPGGGPSWLSKAVDPGGAADNKLLIEHKDWDADLVEDSVPSLMSWEDNGGGVTTNPSTPPDGYAWIEIETWRYSRDRKGHSDLVGRQPDPVPLDPIYLKWLALPHGLNEGEMLYWDGLKWVILSPPAGGDHVLMSSGGAPFWQQVQEFQCPGGSGGGG